MSALCCCWEQGEGDLGWVLEASEGLLPPTSGGGCQRSTQTPTRGPPWGRGFPEHSGWVPGTDTPTDGHRATLVSVRSHAACYRPARRATGRPTPHDPHPPRRHPLHPLGTHSTHSAQNPVAEFLHIPGKEDGPPLLVGGVPKDSWTGFQATTPALSLSLGPVAA